MTNISVGFDPKTGKKRIIVHKKGMRILEQAKTMAAVVKDHGDTTTQQTNAEKAHIGLLGMILDFRPPTIEVAAEQPEENTPQVEAP